MADVAAAWGLLLLPAAMLWPIVGPQYGNAADRSLVAADGYEILAVVAIPLVVSLLVRTILGRRWSVGEWPRPIAWTLTGALALAVLVGSVTVLIGGFAYPTVVGPPGTTERKVTLSPFAGW